MPTLATPPRLTRFLRFVCPAPHALTTVATDAPFIVGSTIHLPVSASSPPGPVSASSPPGPLPPPSSAPSPNSAEWHWQRAAAAHAAAHLVASPPVFDGRGLPPITRALLGVLEDARVESLAGAQLPGLRRLWAALHVATPALGTDFESLLLRLARALADPSYDDAHPWVAKGRSLFAGLADGADRSAPAPAPGLAEALRRAASALGHDIGQMRLQFNARLYRPGPDYRDDHRWMWAEPMATHEATSGGTQALRSPPRDAVPSAVRPPDRPPEPDRATSVHRYPEWDRLISRLRADRCIVFEERLAGADAGSGEDVDPAAMAAADDPLGLDLRLRSAVRRAARDALAQQAARPEASHEGERLDLDAGVRAAVAHRSHRPSETRVHRRPVRAPLSARVLVLVDQSASSADAWQAGTALLEASRRVAVLVGESLDGLETRERTGVRTAVCGFSSNGRQAVHVRVVKDFADPYDRAALARLAALSSGDSTRLGAAIRHATRLLLNAGEARLRRLLVIGDGQPHDIDVHDGRYLVEDARAAVREAARQGVRVASIVLTADGQAASRRIFGAGQSGLLDRIASLPRLVRRLLV